MKILIMKIMFIISTMTPIMKNPMSMGLLLMIQTMLMIIIMNKIMTSSWFTMITFLMMIGGLLIIFSYMSSIASNEMFKTKFNLTLITAVLILIIDEMTIETQMSENLEIYPNNNISFSLVKIYNNKSMFMTIMMVIYLLITMISVSKMVKHHQGPLRSYNK